MPHLPIAPPAAIGLDAERLDLVYKRLEEWTDGPTAAIPGAAVVVGRNGKMVEPRYFGRMGDEPDAKPIRRDGMFLLASISKPVTYLGALKLVERGQLNLSERVVRYIPEFAAHHKEETQVHHLFTHTSGMPDMLPNNVELRKQNAPLSEFIKGAIRDTVPLFEPGKGLSYQSMGTLVVAELVQRISGMSIHAFLKKEIFDPLEMKSTALGSRGLPTNRLVRVETPDYQKTLSYSWNGRYWRELGVPWGGMFTTPEDFAVLCQCMLGGGAYGDKRLWSPATIATATSNRLNDYPELPESIRRTQPWGLGWRLNHTGQRGSWGDLLDRRVFGHTGATGTMVWMDPESGVFCILLTTALRSRAPWRLVQLSNMVAASVIA